MVAMLKKAMLLGIGALTMTKEALEKGIDELVKKGEVSQEEAKEMLHDLWERGQKERDNLMRLVREQTERTLKAFKGASKDEIAALEARIAALEQRLNAQAEKGSDLTAAAEAGPKADDE